MPGGRRKPISECSDYEIRAMLVAGTCISGFVAYVTFRSWQSGWFFWPCQVFIIVWIVTLWHRALRELKKRRRNHLPSDPS